ncbi:MAG TPA: abortive infection family protein [Candidatus Baltobacteraceae bacterium]|nr:abortive infection family protein [Candidatus Baltobacteraceae bacterium]
MAVYRPADKRIRGFLEYLLYDEKIQEKVAIEYAREIENFGKRLEPRHKDDFVRVHEASRGDVRSYLDYLTRDRKCQPTTIRRKMSFLRKYYQYEISEGRLEEDPTEDAPLPDRPPRKPKILTTDEIARLFQAVQVVRGGLGPRGVALFQALYCGLKLIETVKLVVSDYDRRTGTLYTSQSRKPRKLSLSPAAIEAFNTYLATRHKLARANKPTEAMFLTLRGDGITYRQIWCLIKSASKKAGITTSLSPASFRDSFAIHTLMDDPSATLMVKNAFGHRSLHNTQALLEKATELRRAQEEQTALSGPTDELLDAVGIAKVKRQWHKAKQRLASDPDGAITMTRSLLETVGKALLKHNGERYEGLELAPLCRRAVAAVLPQSVVGRENFSRFAQSAANLVENIRGYRNVAGDAHGSEKEAEIARHHAEYAVSLAGATANFLLECHETQKKAKIKKSETLEADEASAPLTLLVAPTIR